VINLYISERRAGEVAILDLKGRVRVGGTSLALHRSVRTLIQEDKTLVLLNLAGVTYIDSCGFGEMIAAQVTLIRKGGELKLLQVTESLRELMSAAKLLDVFEIFDHETDALLSFGNRVTTLKQPQVFVI